MSLMSDLMNLTEQTSTDKLIAIMDHDPATALDRALSELSAMSTEEAQLLFNKLKLAVRAAVNKNNDDDPFVARAFQSWNSFTQQVRSLNKDIKIHAQVEPE